MNDAHRRKIHAAITAAFLAESGSWTPTAAIARKLHNAGIRAPDVMLFVLHEKQAGRLEVGRRAQPGPKAWVIRPTGSWVDADEVQIVGSEFDAFAAKLLAECDVKELA